MPKSRRAKIVPLSKVKPKGREHKDQLIDNIRAAIDNYTHVYTFDLHNIRTNILQQVREERRQDSRLFLGNNKVMQIAIGRDAETSLKPNLYKIAPFLTGICGLLFTNLGKKEVQDYFSSVGGQVFARTGQRAATPFVIPAGALQQFPHSMFEHLLKLGLPVKLDKGVVMLLNDTTVCEAGDTLSAEAAQLLRLFGLQTADFRIELTAHWSNGVARRIKKKEGDGEAADADVVKGK